MEKRFYSPKEVQELLGVCLAHVYNQLASGAIPSIRSGRRILIPATWVNSLG